jgi:hypothetical protein
MKTITKMVLAFSLCCFVSFANAKDLYVSPTGDDSKTGDSETNAVKTLTRVHQLIEIEDILHVKGIIDISAEPNPSTENTTGHLYIKNGGLAGFLLKGDNWNNVTFVGEDPENDGFTGNDASRVFALDGGAYIFKNLSFRNGRDVIGDGANGVWSRNTTPTFYNCLFLDNTVELNPETGAVVGSNSRGGAIHFHGGGTMSLYDCKFSGNKQQLGAGIMVIGGEVNVVRCTFENDNADVLNSNGGAINVWALNNNILINVEDCLFKDNYVSESGGAFSIRQSNSPENLYIIEANLKNCAFIGNRSNARGGAITIDSRNKIQINTTITNCTFFDNSAVADGGTICLFGATPNSTFDIVNSTVYNNKTEGNQGHGAGLVAISDQTYPISNLTKSIFNCIFDSNFAKTEGEDGAYSDIWVREAYLLEPGEFVVANNYIGLTNLDWSDFPDNELNYKEDDSDYVGFDDADYYGSLYFAIPLLDDSPALTYGDATYLIRFNTEKDQLGKTREIIDGTSSIGSCVVTSVEFDDELYYFPPEAPTGIQNTIISGKISFTLINGEIKPLNVEGRMVLTLYNITGSRIKNGYDQLQVTGLSKGIYIVKGLANGQVYTQKITVQ